MRMREVGLGAAKVLIASKYFAPLVTLLLIAATVFCAAAGESMRTIPLVTLAVAVVALANPSWTRRCWRRLHRRISGRRRRLPVSKAFPLSLETLHDKPPIYSCANFLDVEACKALIAIAEPHLVASTAGGNTQSNGRTSKSCMLARSRPEAAALLARCSQLTGHPVEHLEDPQVARYMPGELYEPHLDAPDRSDGDGAGFLRCGGTRLATVLVYLNDVSCGGETKFTRLRTAAERLVVKPCCGRALLFFPANPAGRVDKRLEHEARAPRNGAIKWVAQVWLRQRVDPSHTFIANPDSV